MSETGVNKQREASVERKEEIRLRKLADSRRHRAGWSEEKRREVNAKQAARNRSLRASGAWPPLTPEQRVKNLESQKRSRDKKRALGLKRNRRSTETARKNALAHYWRNPDKVRTLQRSRQRIARETMSDAYVRGRLANKIEISTKEVNSELLPAYRAVLKLQKRIKEIQRERNN
jgi:hypothetical protein